MGILGSQKALRQENICVFRKSKDVGMEALRFKSLKNEYLFSDLVYAQGIFIDNLFFSSFPDRPL